MNKWAVPSTHSGGFGSWKDPQILPATTFQKETWGAANLWPARLQECEWGCARSETWEGASVSVQACCGKRMIKPRQDANRYYLWPWWRSSGSGASSAQGLKINFLTLIKWSHQMSELLWTHIWSFFLSAPGLWCWRELFFFFFAPSKSISILSHSVLSHWKGSEGIWFDWVTLSS